MSFDLLYDCEPPAFPHWQSRVLLCLLINKGNDTDFYIDTHFVLMRILFFFHCFFFFCVYVTWTKITRHFFCWLVIGWYQKWRGSHDCDEMMKLKGFFFVCEGTGYDTHTHTGARFLSPKGDENKILWFSKIFWRKTMKYEKLGNRNCFQTLKGEWFWNGI